MTHDTIDSLDVSFEGIAIFIAFRLTNKLLLATYFRSDWSLYAICNSCHGEYVLAKVRNNCQMTS